MIDSLALPAAASPPSGEVRPPTAAGQADAGPAPFKEVLAAAQAPAEPEAPSTPATDAAAPVENVAALEALAALLMPLAGQPSADVTTPAPQAAPAAGPAPAVTPAAAAPAQPPAAAEAEAGLAPAAVEPPAGAAAADPTALAALLHKVTAQADVATVSTEAQRQTNAAPLGSAAAKPARPAEASAGIGPKVDELPLAHLAASATSANPAPAADPAIELARLAEAHGSIPAAGPEIVLPQIVRGLESLTRAGATSMHLQLYPETLGRIDVQVSSSTAGMRITLTADSAATGGLLQQNLTDLRQSLAQTGLSISGLSVGLGQEQAAGQSAFAWQRPPQTPAFGAPLRAQTPEPAAAAAGWAANGAGSRVDYRI